MPAAPRKKKSGARVTPIPRRNNPQKPAPQCAAPYVGKLSDELQQALNCLSAGQLRYYVRCCAQSAEPAHKLLEGSLVVRGSLVVPYHKSTESEDDQYSENESEDKEDEEEDEEEECKEPGRKRVAIGDKTLVARWANCENCQESFDFTENERGDCRWHPQEKAVDFASDIWENHNAKKISPRLLHDNHLFQSGFLFPCCRADGNEPGCKFTKHKAEANKHIGSRFHEEDARHIVRWAKCANCGNGFDQRGEEPETCTFHPDAKTADWRGDFWADHDEDCHGMIDSFVDDSDLEDGFMWDCCEGHPRSRGCTNMGHSKEVYRQ